MSDSEKLDSLISKAMHNGMAAEKMRGIGDLPAFRRVVDASQKTHHPDDALRIASNMVLCLMRLYMLVEHNRRGILSINDYKEHARINDAWSEKKYRLAELMNEAAELFDSGQHDPDPDSSLSFSLEDHRKNGDGLFCGSEKLREWARLFQVSPTEVVFPIACQQTVPYISPKSIRNRGAATDPDAALRGVVVREIARHVDDSIDNRYATISKLAQFVGTNVDPKYVRSLLLQGQT